MALRDEGRNRRSPKSSRKLRQTAPGEERKLTRSGGEGTFEERSDQRNCPVCGQPCD